MKLNKITKLAVAFAMSAVMALIAAISISAPAMEVRQAMFVAAANHATLYVTCVAIFGFFFGLYLVCKIDY
jgi:hypothetical protein